MAAFAKTGAQDGPGRIVAADAEGIRRAAELLRRDAVVAFPTETVYGLGANALSAAAVGEIYRLKRRPAWNPLIAHVAGPDEARALVDEWPATAQDLADRFWPGPLTIVLRRSPVVPAAAAATTELIAIRVPAHPVALELLRACGLPLAAPSANRSESVSPTTAQHVLRSLPDVPLVLDGGSCRFGIESTIVDLSRPRPRLLRPGALPLRAIRAVVGAVDLPPFDLDGAVSAPAPGMARRHYAPRARLLIQDELDVAAAARPVGVLAHRTPALVADHVELLPNDAAGYAADLYAALHRLDDAAVATILVERPPPGEDWIAVHDRLKRAAA
ncbi:L-threonylcarbamoyladenylate synthase [Dactylosporangium matsuzakiense]|uniref:Threonylcarbamoyl-AMP synthase n=1 Tax=Dactylosporangium matsuzakiense TaxID=53360 RepID=A0A9W6NS35_9ACTN|nr:L-threonylcarbamoyladenylate synthase [Dactylosporangium matsuzakiense]UWZ46157.1 threonylcarbamoyl-AMP synthase [Dactylosporangium matsuzakiense]GLL07078.1 threonylcarbamoyl-AMP synthase [Dactylosporangium matsuzakiense]